MSWTKQENERINALHGIVSDIRTSLLGDISGDSPGILAELRVNAREHKSIFKSLRWILALAVVAFVVGAVAASDRIYDVIKTLSNIL